MAAKARASALIGTVISGRYRVVELLALGGVGAVYLGEHVLMHKHVAVKVLHPDAQNLPDLVPRFEREAVAGAHIVHPNVAAATDFGQLDDGSYFLVLEYVRGTTLREVIRRGPVSSGRVAGIGRQMAAGLGAAHAMGIVHRDVKPRNVMLIEGERDVVKIIDFGLAKLDLKQVSAVAASRGTSLVDERITTSGAVFGTIAYLAPEAALGMDTVDARADLYALGLTMYELLAGKHPFDTSDPVELFRQHHKVPPPPVAERTPGVFVPPALEAVVMRLLEKDPEARFPTTDAVIAAIDASIDVSSPTVPPAVVGDATPIYPGPSIAPLAGSSGPSSLPPPSSSSPGGFSPGFPPLPKPIATPVPPPSFGPPPPLAAPSPAAPQRRWAYAAAAAGIVVVGVVGVAAWPSGDRGAAVTTGVPVAAGSPVGAATTQETPAPPATRAPPASTEAPSAPASASPAPPKTFDAVAARTMFRRTAAVRDWVRAKEAFFALVEGDPASFHDATLLGPSRDVASAVGVGGGEDADRIFDALGHRLGADGADILYEILRTRGGSKAAVRAEELLRDDAVLAHATPELRITVALRNAPCPDKPALLDRAVAEGDARTLVIMQTMVAACPGRAKALDAQKALKARLKGR